MFVDEVKVYARAGHGGRGCVAFLREAFRPKGGPIGGDGGRGGSIILRADHDVTDLTHVHFAPHLRAGNGGHGLGKGMNGRAAADLVIKVPRGTLVWRIHDPSKPAGAAEAESQETGDTEDHATGSTSRDRPPKALPVGTAARPVIHLAGGPRAMEVDLEHLNEGSAPDPESPETELVADLTDQDQEVVLCKGGRGGLGNRHFATARRQTPRFAQPGEPGEEGTFRLELRLIADVGLVGYPNAGKSTLLTAISRARPKVAPYPFTTLHPQVGVVEYADWHRVTVCDVPGLVEGAHMNVGLGHAFLRHISRCKALAIILDMAGSDGRKPWEDFRQILKELELYDSALLDRPRIVVANKMDEPDAAELLRSFKRRIRRTPVIPLAAAFDEGIDDFRAAIRTLAEQTGA
jgi:GTP-binding protein